MTELEVKWASYTGITRMLELKTPNGVMKFRCPVCLVEWTQKEYRRLLKMLTDPWTYSPEYEFMDKLQQSWKDYEDYLSDRVKEAEAKRVMDRCVIPETVVYTPQTKRSVLADIKLRKDHNKELDKGAEKAKKALADCRKKHQAFNQIFKDYKY